MHKPAILVKAAFQNETMEVRVESQKLPRRLVGQNHCSFYACLRRPVVKPLDNSEDNSADIGKQATVVAEVGPQDAWYRENELPMGQTQQQMIPHVLRKQERPFLRAGGAEVERFTGKWTEVLEFAFGIGALDTSDAPGVVPAKNELLNRLGDPLDTESAVDDSELAFILFHDALKMLFKQNLEVIDPTRPVHPLGNWGDRKGSLRLHIEL